MVKAKLANDKIIEADKVLVAIGRQPKTMNIGLETVHVETTQKGFIKVNEKYQTTNLRIYAVGDVIGEPLLAHKAILESIAAARNILGEESFSLNYQLIPHTIFSGLEIAWIGYTERELRSKGIRYRRIRMPISHLSAVRIKDSKYSYVKILMGKNNVPYGIFVVSVCPYRVILYISVFIYVHSRDFRLLPQLLSWGLWGHGRLSRPTARASHLQQAPYGSRSIAPINPQGHRSILKNIIWNT
ncbi:FAD-dependent oxidoreductase [Staphylothermus hellenicus]|uniref:FAD-dependent oxidoreductase n=1 Tax=Staphylothermus hellenicus TaxID=84599 RepID=UPI0001C43D3D|nr:FAD-dependent oxidoreductase [Staphylothermus hellenicus]